ncbi:putative Microspherule protein 1 [Operophtera brumata]|uniref:Putative Microspherule protein 1 n=1 Tax=Operophtera brumata TaxID=104452 RepID=A0A0L7LUC8_OPEBR|nr:putative Microspherule protein 1 [Operophtera brumata]
MEFPATPSNALDNVDYSGASPSPYHNSNDDNKRRRFSSRSIKRRRFDDELVEYSLQPGASIGKGEKRIRTQSYTSLVPEFPMVASSPITPNPPPPPQPERRRAAIKLPTLGTLGRKTRRKGLLIHRGVKFSCRFTVSELQSRWYALLYNAEVSRVAVAAMSNLHPDLVAANKHPKIEEFQELLEANPHVFYPSRTAKTLMAHWQLLKQYQLLPDQTVHPLPKNQNDKINTFSDAEETMNDAELPDYKEDGIDVEMQLADRCSVAGGNVELDKNTLAVLRGRLVRYLMRSRESVASVNVELDKNTLAVLRGRLVRYLVRSRESWHVLVQSVAGGNVELDKNTLAFLRGRLVRYIAVGRSTRDHSIDVDLSLEGPATKVSRKQATIRLRNTGDFFMSSEGKRPIFVDGRPILQGNKVKLNHNSVIEIAGLRFIFLVNQELISAIRQEAVKVNIPV